MRTRGFTLVEVMLAVVILAVGVLALAGTSARVVTMNLQGGRLGGASLVAEGRLELLRAAPCAALASGSTLEGPFTVAWTVTTSGSLKTVALTVSYVTGGTTHSDAFATTISCAT